MDVKDLCQLPNTVYMKVFMDTEWKLDFQSKVCLYHYLRASDVVREQWSQRRLGTEQLAVDRLRATKSWLQEEGSQSPSWEAYPEFRPLPVRETALCREILTPAVPAASHHCAVTKSLSFGESNIRV